MNQAFQSLSLALILASRTTDKAVKIQVFTSFVLPDPALTGRLVYYPY